MARRQLRVLKADERGSTAIEFAFIATAMVSMIVGLLQVSTLLYAAATMRNALGHGGRTAMLYRPPVGTATWTGPTALEICNKVKSDIRSLGAASITGLTLTRVSAGTAFGLRLNMNYTVTLNFVGFTKTIPLSANRTVYVNNQPNFGDPAVNCLSI